MSIKRTCERGHPYSPANTGRRQNGNRYCRTCLPDLQEAVPAVRQRQTPGLPPPDSEVAWQADAACRYTDDPDAWFVDRGSRRDEAVAVCRTCPVKRQCEDYAARTRQPWGVWGGKSLNQWRAATL